MKKQGFTLVELLIYMGLLTIFLGVVTRMFIAILDVQLSSESTGAVAEDARYIYSRLAFDLAQADAVVSPSTAGVSASTLALTTGPVTTTYSVNGTRLMRADDKGSSSLNSYGTNVSNVTFTDFGPVKGKQSIQITYTITGTIQSSSVPEVRTIEMTIAQR